MAVGDAEDMRRRLRSLVPGGWFADVASIRRAVFGGLSDALSWAYGLLQGVKAGTRRAGTTGWLLDVDAWGFFQESFRRRRNQGDDAFRKAYTDEIFRDRATRPAIVKALSDLTGVKPKVVELWSAGDCGAYDGSGLAYAGQNYAPAPVGGYDLNSALDVGVTSYDPQAGPTGTSSAGMGMWGDLTPYQLFVTAYRPLGGGILNADGIGVAGGYDLGLGLRYAEDSESVADVSDAEILACVANTEAAGVTAWTAIQNTPAA